ncbi:MAG: hypothetical protein COA83_04150 [Methylophaga sp.]|nr:MAG: hypothetical protein COA83_04150 [Methylophaga sp.]
MKTATKPSKPCLKPLALCVLAALYSANANAVTYGHMTLMTVSSTLVLREALPPNTLITPTDVNGIKILTLEAADEITTTTYHGIFISGQPTVDSLVIDGNILSNAGGSSGIMIAGTDITSLTNTGSIEGQLGLMVASTPGGTPIDGFIDSLTNTGTIIGSISAGIAINSNGNRIRTLTNMGVITGGSGVDISVGGNGSSLDTLINAQGNGNALTFRAANTPGTYKIYITSTSDYGQLSFVNVGGADINFSSMTFGIAEGSTLANTTYADVITNDSAVAFIGTTTKTGTYLYNGSSIDWSLIYDGTYAWNLDITGVSVVAGSPLFDASLALGNTASLGAAQAIDASPELLALFSGAEQQLSDAVESTLPGISGGVSQMTNIAINAVTGVVSARQDSTRGLSSGDGFMTDRHIWFKPFGGWTEQDTRQGVNGYDIDSYGLAVGFDGDVSSTWNVGVALAYINSDVESNLTSGSHSIDMDSYMAKVYATKMIDDVTALNIQVGAGISDYDSKRLIFTGDVADADYDSWNVQLSAELERSYNISDKTVVTPYAHADYSYVSVEDYNESGAGALNLNVDDDSNDSLIIGVGAKANHSMSDSLLLMANVGVGYDVMTDRSSLTSSFAGGGAQFSTEGIEPDEFVYNAGLGAKYSLENGTEITASYNVTGRQDYTDQSLSANFRFMF